MTTSSKRTHRRNKLNRFFYIFMCFVLVIGLSAPTSAIGDASTTDDTATAQNASQTSSGENADSPSTDSTNNVEAEGDSGLIPKAK